MKNTVTHDKYYKISTGRILFLIFIFSLSICLVSEAKTFDYYYLNPAEAQKKVDECKKWEKNISDKEKNLIMAAMFSGNTAGLSKKTINMLNECENAEKSISAKSFVRSVDYYKTHLKDAMKYIQSCKNDNSLPADEKEQYSNAVKAVKESANGDIKVQSYDEINILLGFSIRTVAEFEQKPEEAKALFKTCINADGSLKSKEELKKIDSFRYEEYLNADKAINKNWIGSKELREQLQQFVKENQL